MGMHDGQKIAARLRANGRNAAQQGQVRFQFRVTVNMVVDILLQLGQLCSDKRNRLEQRLLNQLWCIDGFGFFLPIQLTAKIVLQRLAPSQQRL